MSFFAVMTAREVVREEQIDSLNECHLLALNLEASSYEDTKIDLMDVYHAHTSRFNFPHFISCLTLRDSYAQMHVRTGQHTQLSFYWSSKKGLTRLNRYRQLSNTVTFVCFPACPETTTSHPSS